MGRIIPYMKWKIKHVPNHQPDQIRIITWMWRPQLQISQNYSIASGDAVTSGPKNNDNHLLHRTVHPWTPNCCEKKNNAFFLTQKASLQQLFSSGTMQEPASPAMVLAFQTCVSLEPTFRRISPLSCWVLNGVWTHKVGRWNIQNKLVMWCVEVYDLSDSSFSTLGSFIPHEDAI